MGKVRQRPGDPFIEKPDEVRIENDGSTETTCWKDGSRICTGDCEAFDPQYATDETGRFTACRIINMGLVAASALSNLARFASSKPGSIPGQDVKPMEAV